MTPTESKNEPGTAAWADDATDALLSLPSVSALVITKLAYGLSPKGRDDLWDDLRNMAMNESQKTALRAFAAAIAAGTYR